MQCLCYSTDLINQCPNPEAFDDRTILPIMVGNIVQHFRILRSINQIWFNQFFIQINIESSTEISFKIIIEMTTQFVVEISTKVSTQFIVPITEDLIF